MNKSVGILGIGAYLPPTVKTNDAWPAHIVERWQQDKERRRESFAELLRSAKTPGRRATAEALLALIDDPFQGVRERRIKAEDEQGSDLELKACRDLLSRTDVDPATIDMVLSYETVPDILIPRAGRLHHELGLPRRCRAFGVDAGCYSFLAQLGVAQAMIRSGQVRRALLTQASVVAQFTRPEDPSSPWFGDAGTAVLVGPVEEGRGVLAEHHSVSGEHHDCIAFTTGNGRLIDPSPLRFAAQDPKGSKEMLVSIADRAHDATNHLCTSAGHDPSDLDFLGCHQATRWMRPVLQGTMAASKAASVDHFAYTGSIGACNLPFQLATAWREGTLRDGDLVGLFSGGAGETWGGVLMRWTNP